MIAVDTNLLVYAHREDGEFHSAAKESVDFLRHQPAPWAIPWSCIHEFIGIVTHPGIYKPASTLSEALDLWILCSRRRNCTCLPKARAISGSCAKFPWRRN